MTVATLQQQSIGNSIAPNHYKEWLESAVNREIIEANVRTIYDQLEVDKLLNRRTKKMWKRPTDLVPCWAVTGVDPLTDMPTSQGVQVKPNTAPLDEKGKPRKYLGAKDSDTTPLFLDTAKEGYWPSVLENISTPIIITEGAKKAGALLSHGYAGISIPGVSTCRKRGRLHQNLEIFMKVGRAVYLCFDNDILQKKPVQDALKGLGALLRFHGAVVMVIQLPAGNHKGVDDYIKAFGRDAFQLLVENALTIQEWLDEVKDEPSDEDEITLNSRLATYYQMVRKHWGEHIRYNTLKKRVELNGGELDEDEISLTMANVFDIDISLNHAQVIIRNLSRQDEYSPVCEYLDEVSAKFPEIDTTYLDDLAEKYFGTNDPIHSVYFKKFLIASVARARQPGCKVDSVFMLMSPEQGKYKSTFFSVLFGEDFFSDQLGTDIGNKDEKMKISQYWCLEWAEFEAIYRRKDVSALKNFITNREDTFRAPYARKDAKHPRPCVFVGTSNEKEILHDPTGDRRFWIVPVITDKIPLATVRADRDKIWATANALYKAGYQWWLLDSEELIRAEKNKEYQETSYWDEVIEAFWHESFCPKWMSTEAIAKRLGFETAAQMKPGDNNQLKQSMTRLGFQKKTNRGTDGLQRRGWEKLEDKSESFQSFSKNSQTPVTGVTTLPEESSSCYTPVTPPVTGVTTTEANHASVTPVTPPVTEVYQPEALSQATVTPVTGVSDKTSKFSQGNNLVGLQSSDEAIASGVEVKESDCWYTPPELVKLVQTVLGGITLDPCADDGKHIEACQHFTAADDGLSQSWSGRVYMNPPYSHPAKWISKLQSEYECGNVTEAIALVPASTDTQWLHPLLSSQLVCFWRGRIKFLDVNYQPKNPARQSHCFIYWGNRPEKFREVFAAHGAFNKDASPKPDDSIYDPQANADLLRECIGYQDWEMIKELTEDWPQNFKKSVFALLTPEEQQSIWSLKPVEQPQYDDAAVPLIQEKAIFWSLKLAKKVEIFNIVDETKSSGVYIVGEARYPVTVDFDDLRCCEESPRCALGKGDTVLILTGKKTGELAGVRRIGEDRMIYLSTIVSGKLKPLAKPYFAHQLHKKE
ncbi:virulence-associated E family protein [Cylindrospermum sp. NIES-4074]|nr:virulence-associated E family protein [Cylindrospermum sp. NIES-4074]